MGLNIQSKRIRTLILSLAQELRSTLGKMPNKVVVTSGQVVTIFRGSCNRFIAASKCRVAAKIYPTSVLYPQFCFFVRDELKFMPVSVLYIYLTGFQNNLFFYFFFLSNKLVPFKYKVLCECLRCRPQLTAHARGIKNSV